jgi:hypothetical protein
MSYRGLTSAGKSHRFTYQVKCTAATLVTARENTASIFVGNKTNYCLLGNPLIHEQK